MAGSKVPTDPNMSSEVRRFLDDRAKRETSNESRLDALETTTATLVFATEAQAQAGTSTTLYMSPARVVDTIYAFSPFLKFAHYQDQKSSGTAGGDHSGGGNWDTRVINTEVYDNIGITLASNTLTIPAGTYFIDASSPAYSPHEHRIRLYDVTGAAVIAYGTSEHAESNTNNLTAQTRSFLKYRFTVASANDIRIEHYIENDTKTPTESRLGRASSAGTEIYTDIMLWKLTE